MDHTPAYKHYLDYDRKNLYKSGKYYLFNIEPGFYRNNSTRKVNQSRSRSRSRNRNSGIFNYESEGTETIKDFRMRLVSSNNGMTVHKLMYIFEKILYGKDYKTTSSSKFNDVINTLGFEEYLMKLLLTTKKEYADTTKGAFSNCFNIGSFEKVKFNMDNGYTKAKIGIVDKGYDEVITEFRKLHKEIKELKGGFNIRVYKDGRVEIAK
jgi:hypothetical protein